MTSTQINVPDGGAPSPANPRAKMTPRQWLASIGVGVLLGGLFFGFQLMQSVTPAAAADAEPVAIIYAGIESETDNGSEHLDEHAETTSDLPPVEEVLEVEEVVEADWFAALAEYGRDWVCTHIWIAYDWSRNTVVQHHRTLVGQTLEEVNDFAEWRYFDGNFSDIHCRNSSGEEVVFPGSDNFSLVHVSTEFPQVFGG